MRSCLWVAAWLACAALLALPGCDYSPGYAGSLCAPGGGCPEGYACVPQAGQYRCQPEEQVPDAQDGDAGQDAEPDAEDGADGEPDGADAEDGADGEDGEDAEPDGEDGEDGADGEDGEDAEPDGGDEVPTCPQCTDDQYCDESTGWQCQSCEDNAHCGEGCLACAAGETCESLAAFGGEGFCCLGLCEYPSECRLVICGQTTMFCWPDYTPTTFTWIDRDDASTPYYCPLTDQDGILPERLCDSDPRYLRYNCPWDGLCQPDGTCGLDPVVRRVHDCGAIFGCFDGRCRMHKAPGQACLFNWDCDSYCCSRDQNATCLEPGTPADQCKIRQARFFRGGDRHCFDTGNADRAAWFSNGDQDLCGTHCDNDRDCDSGNCDNSYLTDWDDRCVLDSCLDEGDDQAMQGSYFCPTGDSGAHITSVTNGAPEPTEPENCTFD